MRPVNHPSNNETFGGPQGSPLNVSPLSVTCAEMDGIPFISSFWKPSKDELAVLNAGGTVRLNIAGTTQPVVSLAVDSEKTLDMLGEHNTSFDSTKAQGPQTVESVFLIGHSRRATEDLRAHIVSSGVLPEEGLYRFVLVYGQTDEVIQYMAGQRPRYAFVMEPLDMPVEYAKFLRRFRDEVVPRVPGINFQFITLA